LYVASSYSGTAYGTYTSTDLTGWSAFHTTGIYMTRVTGSPSRFVGVNCGSVFSSSDGATFGTTSGSSCYQDVSFTPEGFFLVGSAGVVALTTDGTTINSKTAGTGNLLGGTASSAGTLVAVGDTIVRSTDSGASFQQVSTTTSSLLYDVTASDGTLGAAKYVAVGSKGRILATFDGTLWRDVGFANEATDLLSVTFGGGKFVAGGTNKFFTSPTGQAWTPVTPPTSVYPVSMAYGNGVFVGISNNFDGFTSPDGTTITLHSGAFSTAVRHLDFAAGQFFASGDSNTIYTSPDGVAWSAHTVGGVQSTSSWTRVIRGNGVFVAQPTSGQAIIATSVDGATWAGRGTTLAGNDFFIRSLGFDGRNYYVLAGNLPYLMYRSTDLVAFTSMGVVPRALNGWNGVAFNATLSPGRVVAVGDDSIVLTIP
jgi:hypothetical protein